MGATADLTIRISGDVKNYDEALEKAQGQTENLSTHIQEIGKAAAIAFAALTAEIGLSVAAFKESEQATNQLSQALKNQGIFSKQLVSAYSDQASALQHLTGVSDETITKSQTILQSFLGQQQVTEELTKAVLDFSAAKQIDAQSASEIFGKAIEGNVGVLKRYGIEIDDNLTKQQRLDQITKKVSETFGGQAEAAASGLGALNKMKEAFSDLQEKIGEKFAPIIEKLALKFRDFFETISNNPALISLASALLAGGAAIAAVTVGLAGLATALIAANAAAIALEVSLAPLLLTAGGIAVAIAGVAAAVGYFATKQKDMRTSAELTSDKISELREDLEKLQGQGNRSTDGKFFKRVQDEIDAKKAQLQRLEELQEKQQQQELQRETQKNQALNEESRKAAEQRANEQKRIDALTIQQNKAKQEVLRLQESNASADLIAIKQAEVETLGQLLQERNRTTIALLEERLATEKLLEEDARQQNFSSQVQFNNDLLVNNEEYQALDDDQKAIFREKNEANLRSQLLNENGARQQAALERANIQAKEHNTFLLNQQKFGTAYATINQIMMSAVVQGAAKGFSELTQLQQSNNATLKSIGKIAAVADITIRTAQSAMAIYSGFATIPIIGPVLGVAGAAAAVAFGAERIGQVNAAAEGGLLEGGIPGVDSIPVLAQQDELITPRQNFDEVVESVADKRLSDRGFGVQNGGSDVDVNITIKPDEFLDFIEIQQVRRKRLGTSRAG